MVKPHLIPRITRYNQTGKHFGHWTVLNYAGKKRWWCLCKCGVLKSVLTHNLTSGRSTSCGCRRHGMSQMPIYAIWAAMVQRCTNPRSRDYHNYGGRGIRVCNRWLLFESFYVDMGSPPFKGATLERKDNNGPYNAGNCCWATRLQQSHNSRRVHLITFNGVANSISQWAEFLGIKVSTLSWRLRHKWSLEQAMQSVCRDQPKCL